jgi:hypothetical protein
MANIRIKSFGSGKYHRTAATKVFIRDSTETRKGCRWLEPGEIVAMDDDEAAALVKASNNTLEITLEAPNRPMYFSNPSAAADSSMHNVAYPGRADEAKKAMEKELQLMQEKAAQDKVKADQLNSREEAIRLREIELGLREPDDETVNIQKNGAPEIVIEDDAYIPSDNVVHRSDIDEEREKAAIEDEVLPETKPKRARRARG